MCSLVDKFENKRVLLWGYGLEGKSSERFLRTYCNTALISVYEGSREELPINEYDYVIKSPGVPYIYTDEPKITSQTELFLNEFSKHTIGITGTKGKSTTTSMIYKILKDNLQQEVCLLGNIGLPCLDAYEEMKNGAWAVYEMSCHQLANNKVSPHIAVFLNLFEDHLDYYKTRDNYFNAKAHITKFQSEDDYYIYGETVPSIETKASKIVVPWTEEGDYELEVLGIHNQWNAKVADEIATRLFLISKDDVRLSLKRFAGLPHRLEKFATINGVTYYDDSISTIPEATISAIMSVKDAKTVIVGGMDRGIDYSPLVDFVPKYKSIDFIFCYESGERVLEEIKKSTGLNEKELKNCFYVNDLKSAAELAKIKTAAGSVIMSPAAASYGYFKNFEQRGEFFKKCILDEE